MTSTGSIDPRTVDADGFVIGAGRQPAGFGSRPGVGGLGATVAQGRRVGLIVGLDTDPSTGGLLLHLAWLPAASPNYPVSERDRQETMRAAELGQVPIEAVPAEGLIALDAWMPDDEPAEDDEPVKIDPTSPMGRLRAFEADGGE
jgi:hypothetical protein